ncbi:uncharacterized protein LOC117873489 isoform X2 [Trachemys scripta elegans]|uniref:uncharacterized protein LOC117873489 isoform X2 n=1 Tax=Trachemys scripta elegans TaxID=31138 RepID=UPI00155310AE|nr:uncharacterized protein LOC117873489 isoform X2 [Trachemys scripta elegans]
MDVIPSRRPATFTTCVMLRAVLSRDITLNPHSSMDTFKEPESQTPAVNREKEENGRQVTRGSWYTASQGLFLTPLQSSQFTSQAQSAIAACKVSPFTPTEHPSQMRRKKRTWDDKFSEILKASATLNHEHWACRMNIAGSLEKQRVERRKKGSGVPAGKADGDAPRHNGASQAANTNAIDPGLASFCSPLRTQYRDLPTSHTHTHFVGHQRLLHYPSPFTPGEIKDKQSFRYTNRGSHRLVYV